MKNKSRGKDRGCLSTISFCFRCFLALWVTYSFEQKLHKGLDLKSLDDCYSKMINKSKMTLGTFEKHLRGNYYFLWIFNSIAQNILLSTKFNITLSETTFFIVYRRYPSRNLKVHQAIGLDQSKQII